MGARGLVRHPPLAQTRQVRAAFISRSSSYIHPSSAPTASAGKMVRYLSDGECLAHPFGDDKHDLHERRADEGHRGQAPGVRPALLESVR